MTTQPIGYLAILPGPDRKRSPGVYQYRLAYRSREPEKMGCVGLWEVLGGRMPYQIALEHDEADRFIWHCTCADAVYRAEDEGRVCKHIRGLLEFSPMLPTPHFLKRSA